jgi:hypothetical protein
MRQYVEVWQDEGQMAQPRYSWVVSICSKRQQDDVREETCVAHGLSALDAIKCAIREASRRNLLWGILDRWSEYADMTGQPPLWALAHIEDGIRQRGAFIARHLREIEKEDASA